MTHMTEDQENWMHEMVVAWYEANQPSWICGECGKLRWQASFNPWHDEPGPCMDRHCERCE